MRLKAAADDLAKYGPDSDWPCWLKVVSSTYDNKWEEASNYCTWLNEQEPHNRILNRVKGKTTPIGVCNGDSSKLQIGVDLLIHSGQAMGTLVKKPESMGVLEG